MSDRIILKYLRSTALILSATVLVSCLWGCGKNKNPDPTESDPAQTGSSQTDPQTDSAQTDPQSDPGQTDAQTDPQTDPPQDSTVPSSQSDPVTETGGSADDPFQESTGGQFFEEDPGVVTDPADPTDPIPTEPPSRDYYLNDDLVITDISKYAGIYMEDGSDEVLSDILMLVLKNVGTRDLQLARIQLKYNDFDAEFEVTNLPAGQSVVLLEKNRHAYVEEKPYFINADNVVFFQEPMSLQESTVKLTGEKGSITLENLSSETLGEIYVYYKNSAVDILYGGITYRARVEAGLAPGDTTTVMTGHYNPDTCTIVNVQIVPVAEQ